MSTYRVGNHWGVTIVREGDEVITRGRMGPNEPVQPPTGRRPELVAVVVNGDQALAERICALLNAETNPNCPWGNDCEGVGCSRCDWKGWPARAVQPENAQNGPAVPAPTPDVPGGPEAVRRLTEALTSLVDPDPCGYDHHGECQAHMATVRGRCAHATAKELLAELSQRADGHTEVCR